MTDEREPGKLPKGAIQSGKTEEVEVETKGGKRFGVEVTPYVKDAGTVQPISRKTIQKYRELERKPKATFRGWSPPKNNAAEESDK